MDQDSGEVIGGLGKSAVAAVPSSTADTEILRSQITNIDLPLRKVRV